MKTKEIKNVYFFHPKRKDFKYCLFRIDKNEKIVPVLGNKGLIVKRDKSGLKFPLNELIRLSGTIKYDASFGGSAFLKVHSFEKVQIKNELFKKEFRKYLNGNSEEHFSYFLFDHYDGPRLENLYVLYYLMREEGEKIELSKTLKENKRIIFEYFIKELYEGYEDIEVDILD